MNTIVYNPLDPDVHANPYPHYRLLRELNPVHMSPLGLWVVSRYRDVVPLLRDPRLGHELDGDVSAQRGSMLVRDPPAHTRLRGLVSKAFTPRMLERLRPRIQRIVDEALEVARQAGEIDVIGDLAFPLPAMVISEMLGLPVEDSDQCRSWTNSISRTLDPVVSHDDADEIATDFRDFRRYVSDQIAKRRAHPGDDLITALIVAQEAGDRLTHDELVSNVFLLFLAGEETTTNLIGNGFLALLCNPDELRRLREDPALLRSGVDELLRFDSPVQAILRTVKEPIAVGGHQMERGDRVLLLSGAANRDPEPFPEPDELDVGRPDVRHLSFGGGIHFCLGSVLARIEGRIAIGGLVNLFDDFDFDADNLRWRSHINLRGLESLPVRRA